MTDELKPFEGLSDRATLRIVPAEGGLTPEQAKPILAVMEQLIASWKEKGAVHAGAAGLLAGGHFVAVAYEPAQGDLSGCTKDQLTHALRDLEQACGRRMLDAPKMAVEIDGKVRFLTQREFRDLRGGGTIADGTAVFDHLLTDLGALRAGNFRTTVGSSWYGRVKPVA